MAARPPTRPPRDIPCRACVCWTRGLGEPRWDFDAMLRRLARGRLHTACSAVIMQTYAQTAASDGGYRDVA
mgnify:CR=1 FL=1